MKMYMDGCRLNRLFDDQSRDKIRIETEAVVSILSRCTSGGDWTLIGSDVISLEISKNPDPIKKQKTTLLHDCASQKIKHNPVIKHRSGELQKYNIKLFDSLHLATAEFAKVDVFLTTDERLIRAATRSDINIRVANPLAYYLEVLNNDQPSD